MQSRRGHTLQARVRDERVVVARVDVHMHTLLHRVCRKLDEEHHWPDVLVSTRYAGLARQCDANT